MTTKPKPDKKQPTAPATPTTGTKAPPSIVQDDYNPAEQAGLLRRVCPKLACAVELEARKGDWVKGNAPTMGRFRSDVAACRKQCGRLWQFACPSWHEDARRSLLDAGSQLL